MIIISKKTFKQFGNEITNFFFCDRVRTYRERDYCDSCDGEVSPGYNYIIEELKRQNLLPDDFEKLCCGCYLKKKGIIVDFFR